MRMRLVATYEYDAEPGGDGYEDCETAAEVVELDRTFADEIILRAVDAGDATFTVTEVKAGKK